MKAIVAVDKNWAIGNKGALLHPIHADLRRFRALTMGHTVILGHKTLATFPGGRPLPGRENVVLSRRKDAVVPGATVLRSAMTAVETMPEDSFVIGGESVYRALLPWCDTVYVTRIFDTYPADAWFPNLDDDPHWEIGGMEEPMTEDGVTFQYVTYVRRA